MTTVAQQILNRLDALETQVGDIQLQGGVDGDDRGPRPPAESIRNLSNQLQELRTQMREMAESQSERGAPFEDRRNGSAQFKTFMSPIETMPPILSENFRERWRLWSYKARDYLSTFDPTVNEKMETIESMATPLSDEYIASLNIDDETHGAMKRLMVHKLEENPPKSSDLSPKGKA